MVGRKKIKKTTEAINIRCKIKLIKFELILYTVYKEWGGKTSFF